MLAPTESGPDQSYMREALRMAEKAREAFGAIDIVASPALGGIVPGSSGGAAREIWHDGLILPPLLYQTGDVVNELTALVGDPNVTIHEGKVFVCNIEKA